MKTASLLRSLASVYPAKLREPYDYGGLMAGHYKLETQRIFLSLDFDRTLFEEVLSFKPDLIITHHPFFFGKKKEILERDEEKRESYAFLERNNIPLSSYHTNFDRAKEGMNDAIALALSLQEVHELEGDNMGRGGLLPREMSQKEFVSYVLKALSLPYGTFIGEGKERIRKVAVIGGGGYRSALIAKQEGYDAFISGDCPHHARREIILSHYNYLDIPHEIEEIFIDQMTKTLLKINQNLTIRGVKHERPATLFYNDSK